MPEATSMPVVAARVIVAESSRKPSRPMTTDPSGTATVLLAESVAVEAAAHAAVASSGVDHCSVDAFCQSMMTARPIVGLTDQSTVGSPSPDCQSRYHAMTWTEPTLGPEATAPSVNSEPMAVQPATVAVVSNAFHEANRNIRSPAAGVPGMATVPSTVYSAHVPAVLREIATG